MAYFLRSWADRDTGSDREISRAIYPEYCEESGHPAWFPAQQLGAPREYSFRYVAADIDRDAPVAYATLWELRTHRYRFDLAVRPEWQRQGIATQLLSKILKDAQAVGASGLQARVRDDKAEALEFIRRRGFCESHRMAAYRIDFAHMNRFEFHNAFSRLGDAGFKVTNLREAREKDPHYLEQFYELYSAARDGWPDPDPDPMGASPVPFKQIKRWLDELRRSDVLFIAMDGPRYVGFSSFFDVGTAVHPSYRRRGIATLLKAGSIEDAQHRGLLGQTTSTASPAMRAVLERLGYRQLWSEIRLILELQR